MLINLVTIGLLLSASISYSDPNALLEEIRDTCFQIYSPQHIEFDKQFDEEVPLYTNDNISYKRLDSANNTTPDKLAKIWTIISLEHIKLIKNEMKMVNELLKSDEYLLYHSYPEIDAHTRCFYANFLVDNEIIPKVMLIQEYTPTNLAEIIVKPADSFYILSSVLWNIYATTSFIRSVGRIHDMGIVHSNLMPSNCYLRNDIEPVLIDFEYASIINPSSQHDFIPFLEVKRSVLNKPFAAPEMYNPGTYSKKSDIYSLGIILYQLWTKDVPKDNEDSDSYYKRIKNYCEADKNDADHNSMHRLVAKTIYCNFYHQLILEMTSYSDVARPYTAEIIKKIEGNISEVINQYTKELESLGSKLTEISNSIKVLKDDFADKSVDSIDQAKIQEYEYYIKLEQDYEYDLSTVSGFSAFIEYLLDELDQLRGGETKYLIRWLEDNSYLLNLANLSFSQPGINSVTERIDYLYAIEKQKDGSAEARGHLLI